MKWWMWGLLAAWLPMAALAQSLGTQGPGTQGSANPNGVMSESERGETYKRMHALEIRLSQLSHAPEDLAEAERAHARLQARANDGGLSDTERRRAYDALANHDKILAAARAQMREHDATKAQIAQLKALLDNDKARRYRAVPTTSDSKRETYFARYGAPQPGAVTRPMDSGGRANYERRLKEWKARQAELESRNPEKSIEQIERNNRDLNAFLTSPLIGTSRRIAVNEQIRKNQLLLDSLKPTMDALWEARRNVFDMDNELRQDNERRLRRDVAGVFSDPDYARRVIQPIDTTRPTTSPVSGPAEPVPTQIVIAPPSNDFEDCLRRRQEARDAELAKLQQSISLYQKKLKDAQYDEAKSFKAYEDSEKEYNRRKMSNQYTDAQMVDYYNNVLRVNQLNYQSSQSTRQGLEKEVASLTRQYDETKSAPLPPCKK